MKAQYPVSISCPVLQVSTSGYFKWRHRRGQDAASCSGRAGQLGEQALLARIRAIHAQVKGEYGWPRMHQQLRARGVRGQGAGAPSSCSSTASVQGQAPICGNHR